MELARNAVILVVLDGQRVIGVISVVDGQHNQEEVPNCLIQESNIGAAPVPNICHLHFNETHSGAFQIG